MVAFGLVAFAALDGLGVVTFGRVVVALTLVGLVAVALVDLAGEADRAGLVALVAFVVLARDGLDTDGDSFAARNGLGAVFADLECA